jgi:hypothetical protein
MPFQKGQSGNPGGKPGAARQELTALLDQVFKPARRKKVLERLISDAEAGNHDARTLLLAYTYGKPTEYKEVSGPDGEPLFKAYERTSDFNPDDA